MQINSSGLTFDKGGKEITKTKKKKKKTYTGY
jgi:hypothetical protein